MPYTIRFTDNINKGELIVEDREINSDTSLRFPGRQSTSYGQDIAENFLHLLENFADNNPPANAVEGQMWYDNTTGVDQLKVYDGTNWVASGGLKKGDTRPEITTSVKGDLWVDTDNQQLYLNNGGAWILVGPEFSQGLATGVRAEQILGTDDRTYTILRIDVANEAVAIVTQQGFTPKVTIRGFTKLLPGYNLSTRNFENGVAKYNGVSETAENLVVGNTNVPAANFLRSDVNSTSVGVLRVKNNTGVIVGANGQLSLGATGERALLRNTFANSSFDIQVKDVSGTGFSTAIRAKSDLTVGIATEDPQATLHVAGNTKIDSNTIIDSTDQADTQFNDDYTSGALSVAGGTAIAGNLKVAGDVTLASNLAINGNISVNPDLRAEQLPNITGFNKIEANKFEGTFEGTFNGSVDGASSQASRLTSKTQFKMQGDVSSDPFFFDGADQLQKTFNTTISPGFVQDKVQVDTVNASDEVLINRVVGDTGLFRITQANFVASVPKNPVGMIVPFAGITPPPGWLLCDGTEVQIQVYQALFEVVQYAFKDASLLTNSLATHFALPDFRGRFLLGADNMGGTASGAVSNLNATFVGGISGSENKTIKKQNLPDHDHDLTSPGGIQHYAIVDDLPATEDAQNNVVELSIPTGTTNVSGIPTSGQIRGGGVDGTDAYNTVDGELVGSNLDIMPPYATINYIIFADK
jgi:microcystin-dependent protein/cytoskeletal protein CcmA (bactofilin family)